MNDILCKSDLYKYSTKDLVDKYPLTITPKNTSNIHFKEEVIQAILRYAVQQGWTITDEGILEITRESYGFIRSFHNSYAISKNNSYVSSVKIKKRRLRNGDHVKGVISYCTKQKKAILRTIDEVNYTSVNQIEKSERFVNFHDLTSDFPRTRITTASSGLLSARVIDMITPIGMGQRGLIVAPPKSGKSTIMYDLCKSFAAVTPNLDIFFLLIGERPEEADQTRLALSSDNVKVVSSTFDDSPSRQIQVAENTISHAKKLAEIGRNVVILLDSLTRLVRAYNQFLPNSGKVLSGGIEYSSLQKGKEFFGTARNTLESGSVTIIGTCLIETGSRMDDVIFEEFKGTGNMELFLNRRASEHNIFPAVNIMKSGTRKSSLFLSPIEEQRINLIRHTLSSLNDIEALSLLLKRLRATKNNEEFLNSMNTI